MAQDIKPNTVPHKPPPLKRDYNRDPNNKALKRRGFINQGSSFRFQVVCCGVLFSSAPFTTSVLKEPWCGAKGSGLRHLIWLSFQVLGIFEISARRFTTRRWRDGYFMEDDLQVWAFQSYSEVRIIARNPRMCLVILIYF